MHAALKLRVRIPKDRRVQLPADVPEGAAEIIVLYPESAVAEPGEGGRGARSASKRQKVSRTGQRRGSKAGSTQEVDYFARLVARQPRPLSAEASRALDEANRGDR